eukprot:TRINITY_DN167_c0_g1_i1.p1 TRINITY_DN167_c0_g1~~TRINITY_DN167_c0_g1_i1.p1  ORF type:complete len:425 (+),score=130.38 TRINITY_DN167_c0_g1_i1:68-1276(+)
MSRFLCILALCYIAVVTATYYSTCSTSGDPHFTMFDGGLHDFQGKGVFQMMNTPILSIQSMFGPYNGSPSVSCIRASVVAFYDYDEFNPDVVQFGWWPSTGYDVIRINGQTYPAASFKGTVELKNKYVVAYSGGRLTIRPPATMSEGYRITMGVYYLNVDIPESKEFASVTVDGLCGNNDGDATNDYTDYTGTQYAVSGAAKRVNGMNVNKWAAMYNVSTTSYYKPIVGSVWPTSTHNNLKTVAFSSFVPQATMVTAEEDTQALKVEFTDLNSMDIVKAACEKLIKSLTDAQRMKYTLENCMFDAARDRTNMVMAGSTVQSALEAESSNPSASSSSSSTSSGAVAAAVICSIIAAIAIGAAVYYFWRTRRLAEDLTKALVPMNQPFVSNSKNDVNLSVAGGI